MGGVEKRAGEGPRPATDRFAGTLRRAQVSAEGFGLVLALTLGVRVPGAVAQTSAFPGIDPARPATGADRSLLGPAPGSGAGEDTSGAEEPLLGGRPGADSPRVPTALANPGGASPGVRAPRRIAAPARSSIAEVPSYGILDLRSGTEDQGPPDGLTLDAAIDRLIGENLDLRARRLEIPQAEADVLTAGLRANPILYTDTQLVPYGSFSRRRPGGPTQYDLNISYPFDLSGKRRARVLVAARARRVLEAQYQDAVRLQIDALGTAFVDTLAAAENVRYARAGVEGLDQVLAVTRRSQSRGNAGPDDVDRVEIQRDSAAIGVADAEEALRKSRRTLAVLLNLPHTEVDVLQVRGTVHDPYPPPPHEDELARLALACRPDLASYRLGIGRAEADVQLARANRLQDVYVQYQPYTFQDNRPFDAKSAHSWALGMAVPLPLFNRNQGNVRRAELNVDQTRAELAALERRVVAEARQAGREYTVTRAAIERIERKLLPTASRVRDNALRLYTRGEVEVVAYLNARREYNEIAREYFDLIVRHRRGMLTLNTAVGVRILP